MYNYCVCRINVEFIPSNEEKRTISRGLFRKLLSQDGFGAMKNNTLGQYKNIDEFVSAKLERFRNSDHSFGAMFELMFSERENIIYEKSSGYKIEYVTYGEAHDRVCDLAGRLAGACKDLEKDAVVGLYMGNSLEWIISFWGILKAGFRPLLLNTRTGDEILARTMEIMDARVMISDGKTLPGCRRILPEELSGEETSPVTEFGSEVLVMSSGTTADPKICAYSAREFYCQINDSFHIITRCAQMKKHYEGQLKLLTFLPFYHVFGLIAVYIWFGFFSRTFVHLGDMSGQTILNTIRRHKVTHIFAVPMFWNEVYRQAMDTIEKRGESTLNRFRKGMAIAEKIGDVPVLGNLFIKKAFGEIRDNLFGDSICFLISGGSEIRQEVLSFFNLIGYHLANGYGMTEVGITSVELSKKKKQRCSGTVGQPLSSVSYRIGEDGCLMIRGESTAKYIIENGEKRPRQEWYPTRDLAKNVGGHYLILGREDDVVIGEDGENLNPCLLEPLLTPDSKTQVCIIRAKKPPVPVLLVYAGKNLTREKYDMVRAAVEEKLRVTGLNKSIRKIVFVKDDLMSGGEIKLNRTRLAREYGENRLNILEPAQVRSGGEQLSELMEEIRSLMAGILGKAPEDIAPDGDFFLDEGGNSLDYFALVTKLSEKYGITFPGDGDKSLTTLRQLAGYIEEER